MVIGRTTHTAEGRLGRAVARGHRGAFGAQAEIDLGPLGLILDA